MSIIVYGLILAHLNAYKQSYANIGLTFALTFVFKRLIKSAGAKDNADLIGLGGYSLTIGEFVKLLASIKSSGFKANAQATDGILGGLVGKGVDILKDLLTK